jgi:hypothetical protein
LLDASDRPEDSEVIVWFNDIESDFKWVVIQWRISDETDFAWWRYMQWYTSVSGVCPFIAFHDRLGADMIH